MTQVAIIWLIYHFTNSALLLGITGFLGQLPTFALAPFSGVLADRWNRHRTLIVIQVMGMVLSIALTVLAFSGLLKIWDIVIVSTLIGLVKGLDVPVRQSFAVEMVEKREHLTNAIALNSSLINGARLIGPAIGGIVIAKAGAGVCFLIDSLSYVAVIYALLAMNIRPLELESQSANVWQKLREGFHYAYTFLPIRSILLLLALSSLMGMSYMTLLPIFAVRILHGGSETLGFLTAASGIGALIACVYLSLRRGIVGLVKFIAVSPAVLGTSLMAFALSKTYWFSLLMLVIVGFSSILQVASSNTMIQTLVEDNKRGRVMSFYTMCFMGMSPFGNLFAGSLAHQIGAANTLVVGGIFCILGSLLFTRQLPTIRKWTHAGT